MVKLKEELLNIFFYICLAYSPCAINEPEGKKRKKNAIVSKF